MTLTLPLPNPLQKQKVPHNLCEEVCGCRSQTQAPCLFFDRRGVFVVLSRGVFGAQVADQEKCPKCPI